MKHKLIIILTIIALLTNMGIGNVCAGGLRGHTSDDVSDPIWDTTKEYANYVCDTIDEYLNHTDNITLYAWDSTKSGANYAWDTTKSGVSYAWDSTEEYLNPILNPIKKHPSIAVISTTLGITAAVIEALT